MRFLTVFILAAAVFGAVASFAYAQDSGPASVVTTRHGDGWHFADAKGMALYVYDKDEEPGKSRCKGDCAKTWPPFLAPDDARPLGGWDIIVREDGVRQWTYRGKPVYSYSKDQTPETTFGDGADGAWHIAFQPISIPPEAAMAKSLLGTILVNIKGLTLYTLDDGKTCSGDCLKNWAPLPAPWAAIKNGDWNPVEVQDGTKRWSFKGKVLYTYSGDAMPGDTLGNGAGHIWHAAVLLPAPPNPSWVTFLESDGEEILADASGHTIYIFKPLAYSGLVSPPISEASKVWARKGICDPDCRRVMDKWIPVLAKPDDKPMGDWTIVKNDEGNFQWSFKGYPIYTNGRDENPGEFKGVNFGDISWRTIMRNGGSMAGISPLG